MIFYRPVGTSVWKCTGYLTYACCNSLLCPVDVQYSTLKHWGTCCVLRQDQTADLNHSIRLVSILNPNKTVVWGCVHAICSGYVRYNVYLIYTIYAEYIPFSVLSFAHSISQFIIHNYDVLFAIMLLLLLNP